MAGVQGSALTVAVSNAGGLGSLPCAMLGLDTMRKELAAISEQTTKPFNVNFFCHTQPEPSVERETVWRAALSPYFAELGIDPNARGLFDTYWKSITDLSLNQIELATNFSKMYVQFRLSALDSYDKAIHLMMDSYTKAWTQFNSNTKF